MAGGAGPDPWSGRLWRGARTLIHILYGRSETSPATLLTYPPVHRRMEENPEQRAVVDKMLKAIEREYGFVPVVNQVLSERPDMFIPLANVGKAVLEQGDLEKKQKYLCAISAATAVGGEYCVDVQMKQAVAAGATKEEVFEAIMIGAYMSMTRAESYAFRKFAKQFGMDLDQ